MSLLNYLKPVKTITADQAKEMIKGKSPGEFCLLDVRQLQEYEEEHIPGSTWIPISRLPNRYGELEPGVLTIAYCAIGGRSRAAASILQDAGFKEVYNLKGGIKAWNGLAVDGPPETGTAYFSGITKPEDILLLAYALEEGSRRFYAEMAEATEDNEIKKIYANLETAEKSHMNSITKLFYEITGTVQDDVSMFYSKYTSDNEMEQLVEGQMKLGELLAWAKRQTVNDVLAFAIGLEAKLYDLYFRLEAKYKTPPVNQIYAQLASEEKNHLDLFTELLEKRLK